MHLLRARLAGRIMRTILIAFHATMYVCLCNGITDREIRSAVALGARSLADLQASLGVATACGRCASCACSMMAEQCAETAAVAGGDD